jgi:hypothetical protein
MGLLLAASTIYIPQFIRKRKLEMLFQATADAFQVPTPVTTGIPYTECLNSYARFTREQAEIAIRQGSQLRTQSRLFRNAYHIGQQLKRDFKLNTAEDVMRTGRLVYRLLKIDFQGKPDGSILIKKCFFSAYYSSQICRLISSLDEGLLVGLAGGGKLSFSQRISEGAECCRACLTMDGRL